MIAPKYEGIASLALVPNPGMIAPKYEGIASLALGSKSRDDSPEV